MHAKGAGAHGYFEVTHDVSDLTCASIFNQVGKKTPLTIRFSTVGGELGSSDSARDPRGKSYWECCCLVTVNTLQVSLSSSRPMRVTWTSSLTTRRVRYQSIRCCCLLLTDSTVFFIRDPAKFPHFIHTQKRDPETHLKDPDMFWVRLISMGVNALLLTSSPFRTICL